MCVLTSLDHEQADAHGHVAGKASYQRDRKRRVQLSRRERSPTWTDKRLTIRLRTRPRSVAKKSSHFYRVMLCIARTMLTQDVCLSVCPSQAGVLSKRR